MMNESIATVLIALTVCCTEGCRRASDDVKSTLGRPVTIACGDVRGGEGYFGVPPDRDAASLSIVSETLSLMKEPSLACVGQWDEVYRLSWVPSISLSTHRASIRVVRQSDEYNVSATVLGRPSQEDAWRVESRLDRRLDRLEWDRFHAAVARLDLWHRPTIPIGSPVTQAETDGGSNVVEGQMNKFYHLTLLTAGAGKEDADATVREFEHLAHLDLDALN